MAAHEMSGLEELVKSTRELQESLLENKAMMNFAAGERDDQ